MNEFDMSDIFNDTYIQEITPGKIIKGKVVQITSDGIYLDVKSKIEGKIKLEEFEVYPQIGDELEVLVLQKDERSGEVLLSKVEADRIKAWKNIVDIYNTSKYISGKIVKKLNNGYEVDIGLPAFLPLNHIKNVKNLEEIKDKLLMFKILKINLKNKKVIVSRNEYLKEVNEKRIEEIFNTYKVGDVIEGIVKNITNFGAFIDIGGVDVLIPKSELSWRRFFKTEEVLKLNEKIKAVIISIDKDKKKILASYKNLLPNPWAEVDKNYQVGMIAKGKVVEVNNYGAFVEFDDGIYGFMSIDNMTWAKHIKTPSELVSLNDIVEVKILEIDKINHKIKLGLKQVFQSPLEKEDSKYKIGSQFEVIIKRIIGTGAYVEISGDNEIEGFIPIQEVSWTKKFQHGKMAFRKGEKHKAVVINLDKTRNLVIFSLRQLLPNPWNDLKKKMEKKEPIECKIKNITKRGAYVEINNEIEAFLPVSHFAQHKIENYKNYFHKGQKVNCLIIDLNEKSKSIIVSAKEYNKKKAEEEIAKYIKKEPTEKVKLGDIIKIE